MKKIHLAAGFATFLALSGAPALGHTGLGMTGGLAAGLAHPLLGADHLLAMLAVGLWSGFVFPARRWTGAALFLTAMAAGAALAWSGVAVTGIEGMITASVFVFGALVLLARPGQARWLSALSALAVGVFAASHGYAHAAEATGPMAAYLTGVLAATAGLHAAAIVTARLVARRPAAQPVLGASVLLSALALLAG